MTFQHSITVTDSEIAIRLVEAPDDFVSFLNALADEVAKTTSEKKIPGNYEMARLIRTVAKDTENALARRRVDDLKTAIDDVLDGVTEERSEVMTALNGTI